MGNNCRDRLPSVSELFPVDLEESIQLPFSPISFIAELSTNIKAVMIPIHLHIACNLSIG
jgi:hypothetical protein